jgi:hypothetical protein
MVPWKKLGFTSRKLVFYVGVLSLEGLTRSQKSLSLLRILPYQEKDIEMYINVIVIHEQNLIGARIQHTTTND